jgi:transposase-like protein
MPKKTDPEFKTRAVRPVTEHLEEYPSLTAASTAFARQLGVGPESVRRWVLQADVDAGLPPAPRRAGPTWGPAERQLRAGSLTPDAGLPVVSTAGPLSRAWRLD